MVENDSFEPKLSGIIVSTFSDAGPSIIFNNTELADDEAMVLAIKGMTVIGIDNPLDVIENINNEEERREVIQQFGPFPVKDHDTLKALAISFVVRAKQSNDIRIIEFGRFCVLFLVYNIEHTRLILDSYGLIEPYFTIISKNLVDDKDLSTSNLNEIYRKMNMLFQGVIPRVFTVTKDGVIKEMIGKEIMHRDVFLIADKKNKSLYTLLLDPEMTVWRKRQIYKAASNLNSHLYRQKLTINTIQEIEEIGILLKRYNLSIEGITNV